MVEAVCRDNLIAIAEAYSAARGLSLSTVSRQFHGNCKFLGAFKKGSCSITLKQLDKMLIKFGQEWPRGTPRPRLKAARFRISGKKVAG